MPTEHTTYSFRYDELSEDAKAHAEAVVGEKMAGEWWDENDNDMVRESIVYKLAEELLAKGWNTFGPGDFPGIDGVTVTGWDLGRGDFLTAKGTLTRENAPALPWPTVVEHVDLTETNRYGTSVNVVTVETLPFICTQCGRQAEVNSSYPDVVTHVLAGSEGVGDAALDADHEPICLPGLPTLDESILNNFEQLVRNCLSAAVKAGRDTMEYIGSEESAREWIEINDSQEYTEEGDLF